MAKSLKSVGRAAVAALCLVNFFPITANAAATESQKPGSLLVPSVPSPIAQSNHYTVNVRADGDTQWQPVELYWTRVMVANVTTGAAIYHNSSVGTFDFDGVVNLSIEPSRDVFPTVDSVRIRPLSYDIPWKLDGRAILLTLAEPTNLVVEVNGDVFQVLHLFLNRMDTGAPQQEENKAITSFGPGYHKLTETYKISSGETVYLAPGAVIQGSFLFLHADNARLVGHGVIYGSTLNAVNVSFSNNIVVDGPTVLSPLHASVGVGSSRNVLVRNLRVISSGQWGDGIDTWCSHNIIYERLFMRTADDSLAFYLASSGYSGDSQNITVRDSTVWADVAHPLNVGGFGGNETMSDVTFDNIDILDQHEPQTFYQGCMAMTASNGNIVKNVLFSNIHVENFRLGMLFSFKVAYNPKYDSYAGGTLSNIMVRNVEYNGSESNLSILSGYDKNSQIEFVSFEGLKINGKLIWSGMQKAPWYAVSDYVPMWVGAHVANVTWSE
ncbi:putative endo-polygalacturonase [Aspergillus lucknowensis]|uniref:Pectin lyase fold/virulence factor n=1 Tax=Aspergillus lucknowensis TaxID=176173 RepID=A0ABR4LKK3_9EURO